MTRIGEKAYYGGVDSGDIGEMSLRVLAFVALMPLITLGLLLFVPIYMILCVFAGILYFCEWLLRKAFL